GEARLPDAVGGGRVLQDQRVERVVIELLADIGMVAGRIEKRRDVERGDGEVAGVGAGGEAERRCHEGGGGKQVFHVTVPVAWEGRKIAPVQRPRRRMSVRSRSQSPRIWVTKVTAR